MNTIVGSTDISKRDESDPFFFMIDHCFSVKGKGTVITGTVLQGKVKKGEEIELPELGFKNKIKSMQMFRKDILEIRRGDRAGILVNELVAADVGLV
jgi:selenocysteine-specific elongation factor